MCGRFAANPLATGKMNLQLNVKHAPSVVIVGGFFLRAYYINTATTYIRCKEVDMRGNFSQIAINGRIENNKSEE